jgi:YD repeat-containing protein
VAADYGGHGLVTAVVIDENRISLEYDGRGRLIRYDSPGYVTATCPYDEAGNLTPWTRDARSGAERFRLVYRATYGAHKQPLQETYDYDRTGGDALSDSRDLVNSSYDSQGRRVLIRHQCGFDEDGTIDSRSTT